MNWNAAPYFIVADVVATANLYRDKLGFGYKRFWNDPPSFCMVQRRGVTIMLAQLERPGAMRPNHRVDSRGRGVGSSASDTTPRVEGGIEWLTISVCYGREMRRIMTYLIASFLGGLLGCSQPAGRLDAAHTAALVDSVRSFAQQIAAGITAGGPAAWEKYLGNDSSFYMASEGRMVFPDRATASRAIKTLALTITHIELRWGDSLRVDPLAPGLAALAAPYHETRIDAKGNRAEEDGFFTGLAEHRASGWQLRNAHWSVVTPPPAVP